MLLPLCLLLTGCAATADPKITFGKTVFIGDSITAFWDLKASFPGQDFIDMGIPSQGTPLIKARFERDVIAFHPQTVVILAGTGDVVGSRGDLSKVDLSQTVINLRAMVNDAVAAGIVPILCTVPPVAENITNINPAAVGNFNPLIDALNVQILEVPVLHCDYHAALVNQTGVFKDGVHPNAEGYVLMTAVIDKLKK